MIHAKYLSVVIPAYNEEKIIETSLKKIVKYLKDKDYTWEIIVSDDGSKDNTAKIVKDFKRQGVRLVRAEENQGKGAALRRGILDSYGVVIIFMDADLSVPISNIDKFLGEFDKGFDVIIASRRTHGSEIKVHQPWLRENMGRVFTFLTNVITQANVSDFTCGFKGFTKAAAKKIFRVSKINRWAYDAEIIFLARKFGYKIKEVPIVWENRSDTRVRLKSVVLETFRDLLKIRMYDNSGKYD